MEKPLQPASPERMQFLRQRVTEAHPFAPDRKPLTMEEAIELYMNTSPFRLYLADDNPFKMALRSRAVMDARETPLCPVCGRTDLEPHGSECPTSWRNTTNAIMGREMTERSDPKAYERKA